MKIFDRPVVVLLQSIRFVHFGAEIVCIVNHTAGFPFDIGDDFLCPDWGCKSVRVESALATVENEYSMTKLC